MEPTNHPFRKENDLNQTSMIMFHVNLQGCIGVTVTPVKPIYEILFSAIYRGAHFTPSITIVEGLYLVWVGVSNVVSTHRAGEHTPSDATQPSTNRLSRESFHSWRSVVTFLVSIVVEAGWGSPPKRKGVIPLMEEIRRSPPEIDKAL